ncbi:MAG TPA: regulatory iron-sulfur-containing complex subunit RicT [Gemmatimonadales bacterium]|nr:regulatory iron-sulfur-containing complex subunit RicT [Gemmatimonadales bacterium]
MPATIEVRFKGNRKDYFLWPDDSEPLRLWDPVIVQAERGLDFGRVSATGSTATAKCASSCSGCEAGETPSPTRAVVRRASREEVRTADDLRHLEEDTRRQVAERVRARGLEMKVSDTEWQWDRKRLTVYFTAEKRVDFRELVRDLAASLHTRIDLRQIGARDEAARLGGVGRCGREYCCSTWLTALSPVSLALAKDQHLSLNPAHISGGCGRLLCCLKYEHDFYVEARKRFPKEGTALLTARGTERVVAVDIFRERVFLRHDEEGPRIVTLAELRDELETLGEPPPEHRGPRPSVANAVQRPSGAQAAPAGRPSGATPRPRERLSARLELSTTDAGSPGAPPAPVAPGPREAPLEPKHEAAAGGPSPAGSAPQAAGQPDEAGNGDGPPDAGAKPVGAEDGPTSRRRRRRRRRGRRREGPDQGAAGGGTGT